MRRLASLLVLGLLAFAGCGDDSGTSTSSSVSDDSARLAYIADADAVCAQIAEDHPEIAESAAKLQALKRDDPKFLDKAAAHFALVLEVARTAQQEFSNVEPPADDRAKIDALNSMNAQAIAALEKAEAELRAGRGGTDQLQDYAARLAAADELAKDYGFEVCSRISTGS